MMHKIFLSKKSNVWRRIPRFSIVLRTNFKHFSVSSIDRHSLERFQLQKLQGQTLLMDSGLPNYCDIMLTDVKKDDLFVIAKKLNLPYLVDADRKIDEELHGLLWGDYGRPVVSIIMELRGKRKNVVFIVDTGSPKTYISEHVFASYDQPAEEYETAVLNGHEMIIFLSPKKLHFADVNVLGASFLMQVKARLLILYDQKSLKITGNFMKSHV